MKSQTKIWIGVGAFVVAGAAGVQGGAPKTADPRSLENRQILESRGTDAAVERVATSGFVLTAKTSLPPDLDFALQIAELRGHLLIGDELVQEGQWASALPHFLHPSEEIYGEIRGRLKQYGTPPFATALKALARAVKAKQSGEDYAKAFKSVEDALAATDAGLRTKRPNWDAFMVETALELIKASGNEYQKAIVNGRIAKPIEYQDARGFVWQAEKMLESVAPALENRDAEALRRARAAIGELKTAFPPPVPPKTPVKDYGALLGDVSRVELAAGRLM